MTTPLLGWLCLTLLAGPGADSATGIPSPFGLAPTAEDQAFNDSRDRVRVSVVPAAERVAAGSDVPLAVVFEHDPKWHVYAADPDLLEDYFRTVIAVETTEGGPLTAHTGFIQWPASKTIDFYGDRLSVYEGRTVAYIPMTIAADATPGTHTFVVKPAFQACDDRICLQATPYPPGPGETPSDEWMKYGIEVSIEIVPQAAAGGEAQRDLFAGFDPGVFVRLRAGERAPQVVDFDLFGLRFDLDVAGLGGFILLLVVAAVGGLMLNLTPCVLPVIPLKIMGLSSAAGNRARTLALGTMMSCGVVALWLAIGAAIAAVSGFTATNQLFQYPLFTIGVGVFIIAMAIGMCGLFSVRLPGFVYGINPSHDTLGGSFLFGIMTAILSTPCTAPFMGAASAYAATIHPVQTLVIFAAIGAGMALPYQVLATFPHLVERMPRTGPASELIKQVMGLLMLAGGTYFAGTGLSGFLADPPEPPSRLYWWGVAAFGVAAGAWLLWRTLRITPSAWRRIVFGGLGAGIVALSAFIGIRASDEGPIDWVYYTPDTFSEARSEGNVVVMEFTAEWCLNCKALEKTVLSDRRVVDLLDEDGVIPIKVDLTGNNKDGNAMLEAVDRLTIPLLVVFDSAGESVFKGDFYTADQVIEAVRGARRQRGLVDAR